MSERLLFISFLLPPSGLVTGLYGLIYDRKKWNRYIICIALFVAAFAYSYMPFIETDLIRYFAYVTEMSKLPFLEAQSYGIYGGGEQSLYGFATMCWLVGKLGDPHLVAGITIFVIYYAGMRMTCKVGEDLKSPVMHVIGYLTLFLLLSNLYSLTNNIRNVFSFSVVGLAIFRDCYEKKRDFLTLFLYVFPIFVHPTCAIFYAFRAAAELYGRKRNIFMAAIMLIRPLVGIVHGPALALSGNRLFKTLAKLAIKAYNYYYDTSSEWGLTVAASPSEKLFKIFYVLVGGVLALCGFLAVRELEKDKANFEKNRGLIKIINVGIYPGIMTCTCINMLRPEYWRFAAATILLSGPAFLICLKKLKNRDIKKLVVIIPFLLVLVCFPLWVRNLLRYCNNKTLLMNPIFCSPLNILILDLLGSPLQGG